MTPTFVGGLRWLGTNVPLTPKLFHFHGYRSWQALKAPREIPGIGRMMWEVNSVPPPYNVLNFQRRIDQTPICLIPDLGDILVNP